MALVATSKCRGKSPGDFFIQLWRDDVAKELSIFVDESGDRGGKSRYYLIALVFHDQADEVAEQVAEYERRLAECGLPDIPFHSEPLLNGHKDYEDLDVETRKRLLVSFSALVRRLPISYAAFAYRRSEFMDPEKLSARMKRDISALLFDSLERFQSFDEVKVYYDNGQDIVKRALDQSIGFALSRGAVTERKTSMRDYRIEQAADYLCTMELAAVKYGAHEDGETYNKFFGTPRDFKKNWLKQARRKHI